jgi:hypothetical protein
VTATCRPTDGAPDLTYPNGTTVAAPPVVCGAPALVCRLWDAPHAMMRVMALALA